MNRQPVELYLHNGDVTAVEWFEGCFAMTTINDDMISIPSCHASLHCTPDSYFDNISLRTDV